jgi:TonB family protein
MKKLLLLLSLLLATNASAHSGDTGEHTHIFNQCETKEKIDTLNQPPVPLKLNAPRYPRRAQEKGIEGRVLVEFDVDEGGKAINAKVKWSENEVFDSSVLKSVSSWVFKPALKNGKPILSKGLTHNLTFLLEDSENTLNLGTDFDYILRDVKSGLRRGKVEKPIKKIDSLLTNKNLDGITRAALLYLKASSLYKIKAPNEEIKSLLIESKQHYEEKIVQCARGSVSVKSVTSMKLQTFGGILLGQMYLDESNWQKAEEELSEAILASKGTGLKSQRFYQAYLQLGMASYYQQKWCLAAKSWEKAKILANEYQINFPEQLAEPFNYAQSKI